MVLSVPVHAQTVHSQTDWSGGPNVFGPVPAFGATFLSDDGVSWRSITGQLVLSAHPRVSAVPHVIAPTQTGLKSVAIADLDGDGLSDVVAPRPVTDPFNPVGAVYWWKQTEDGAWIQQFVDDEFHGGYIVDTADVDSDGDMDVVLAAYFGEGDHHDPPPPDGLGRDGHYAWFENVTGDGSSWESHIIAHKYWGARWIEAGDVDGDGDVDLVGASELTDGIWEADGDVVFLENLDGEGNEWEIHELEIGFGSGFEARLGDIDGDGDLDVVGTEYDRIAWYENQNGDGSSWLRRFVTTDLSGSAYAAVGDVDDDGDLDVVGGALNTGVVVWFENTAGTGTVWFPRAVVGGSGVRNVDLVDVEGDGDLDLLLQRTNDAYWIEHLTMLDWEIHEISLGFDNATWLAAGDVNCDGRLDVAVSDEAYNSGGPGLTWFDLTTFDNAGDLVSSILDGGESPAWSLMHWDAQIEAGTSLGVQVRAADDPFNLGPFVDVPSSGMDLGDLIDPNARYVQYRLELSTSDSDASPLVQDVTIESGAAAVGDLNGDGSVDATDLAIVLGSWGPCAGCPADLNGDGVVGPADLAILLGNWT